ncbi:MAG TPA: vWA domain-containing protein, partial [Candidatus Eisenbacteria bacterium]
MNVRSEHGAVIITVALFLLVLLGFVAFGTEAGRWYLLRAELSKTVDAAALAGAKNISNPNVDPRTLAEEFCAENFRPGALGTPPTGSGAASFNVQLTGSDRVQVDGRAGAAVVLGRVLGVTEVPVSSSGAAQIRPVEVMLVLDRSGSMTGQPIADLKVAAKRFLDYFADTQGRDRLGLVSFATSARVDRALGTQFVAPMKAAVDAMSANGYTNPEDALERAGGAQGFTDQTGTPPGDRPQQFVLFFSDGRPNTFRGTFQRRGVTYDAVVHVNGNCDPGDFNRVVD